MHSRLIQGSRNRLLTGVFLLLASILGQPVHAGFFSGTFQGEFVFPVLSGSYIDVDGSLQSADNSSTAIYGGESTSVLTWGAGDFEIPQSSLIFTGYTIDNAPGDTEIALGEISYSNGTSDLETLIFGAQLHIWLGGDPSVTTLILQISILTTVNRGESAFDADFLSVESLDNTFHVYESESATAVLYGMIVGDPVLESTRLADVTGAGFLGTGAVPEPSTATLLALGICGTLWLRRNRRA